MLHIASTHLIVIFTSLRPFFFSKFTKDVGCSRKCLCYYTTRFNDVDIRVLANESVQTVSEHRVGFATLPHHITSPSAGIRDKLRGKKKHSNFKALSAPGPFLRKHANVARCSSQVQRLELIPNPQREIDFLSFFFIAAWKRLGRSSAAA